MKNFFAALALSALTFASPALATELENMTEAESIAFGEQVRAYLLENPEVLMEAIAVLEQRQQDQQTTNDDTMVLSNAEELFNDGMSWVGGNPDGDITLVEFLDYRCGYCKRAHDQVAELIATDGNIRMIVKEYPILGEQSIVGSKLAIATLQVEGPDAYKRMNDALMRFNGNLTDASLPRIIDKLGLDKQAILAKMESADVDHHIARTRALGDRLQITGTPTFVIGGQLVRGYIPLEDMQNLVAYLRNQAN